MSFNCILQLLGLDADVSLRYGSAAVLQQLLNKYDIVTAVFINLRCIKLPKAVRTDSLHSQIITNRLQVLLNGSLRNRENPLCAVDCIIQAVTSKQIDTAPTAR